MDGRAAHNNASRLVIVHSHIDKALKYLIRVPSSGSQIRPQSKHSVFTIQGPSFDIPHSRMAGTSFSMFNAETITITNGTFNCPTGGIKIWQDGGANFC